MIFLSSSTCLPSYGQQLMTHEREYKSKGESLYEQQHVTKTPREESGDSGAGSKQ